MSVIMLNDISGALRSFDQWLAAHPSLASGIDKILLGLGVGLTALGTAALVGALGAMVGTGGLIFALGAAIGTVSAVLVAGHWSAISSDFSKAILSVERDLERLIYDLLHPAQAWKDVTGTNTGQQAANLTAHSGQHWVAAGRGGIWVSDNSGGGSTNTQSPITTINAIQDAALAAMHAWIAAGAPVAVTNPNDIGVAASTLTLQRIDHQMSAPQTGPTQGSYRATPAGSAANSAR